MRYKPKDKVDACVIPLTRGFVAIVDHKNYEWLSKWEWTARPSDGQIYAIRMQYAVGHKFFVSMQQLIVGDVPEGHVITHRNGLGIDNRLSNLLVGPRGLSVSIHSPRVWSTMSRFRGIKLVYKTEGGTSRWQPIISVCGRRIYLRVFDNDVDAAVAWDREAVRYRGPDAWVNFPEKMPEYLAYAKEHPAADARLPRRCGGSRQRVQSPEDQGP